MTTNKPKRGRPKVAPKSLPITLSVDAAHVAAADKLAATAPQMIAGMRATRLDVLRWAIARGLESMHAEFGQRCAPQNGTGR